jgi:oligoribonuclease
MNEQHKNHLVWIDLEMTGLDVESNTILEIATIITDQELNIIAEGPNVAIYQTEHILKKMDEWNKKQHSKSGLLERIRNSDVTLREAENITLSFIKKYCINKKAPLCGNTVGHDKKFLKKYMPKVVEYLHYRIVDVSSFKEIIKRWYPKKYKPVEKQELHLALEDIKESIKELKYYMNTFFIPR